VEPDPFEIALQVGNALAELEAPFYLGGSLASSIHGFPRATVDADIVADMKTGQGARLAELLGGAFYADARAMDRAVEDRRSFNVVHLETMFKVDVFVCDGSPFSRESFSRSRPQPIGRGGTSVRVATPEDTVLHKLLWYRKGGETSDQQWKDSVGVLKVQGQAIDRGYLAHWAAHLGLEDLLDKALKEATPSSSS
jgi:hypothetical protein